MWFISKNINGDIYGEGIMNAQMCQKRLAKFHVGNF